MANILILVIIILTVLSGYRKNLFRNFFDFLSLFLAFVISLRHFGTFASFVGNLPGIKQVLALLQDKVLSQLSSMDSETVFNMAKLRELNMASEFNYFFEHGSFFKKKDTIVFSELSIGLVTNVLAIVILFTLTLFIVRLIGSFIENSNRMAGLTLIDRSGGMVFSLLKSFIYAAIIALVLQNIASFYNSGFLYDLYHKSALAKFFYEGGVASMFLR